MKIRTTVEFRDKDAHLIAEKVARSLAPDNLTSMDTEISKKSAKIHITTEKITSLIATLDDLLMNAKVAEEVLEELDE
ncbi:KEOPS complex subunit Pcc1 [Methanolobus sp. ZRKC2]|uniref:KEOPS complex subunit Pcc1 n=1 Tax=Methanolobus sp. ZRKC2 TaxID=3125783 RepID=UPI0032548E6C